MATPKKVTTAKAAAASSPTKVRAKTELTRGKRAEPKTLGNWGSCDGQASLFDT